jgi:hypothetical protein
MERIFDRLKSYKETLEDVRLIWIAKSTEMKRKCEK